MKKLPEHFTEEEHAGLVRQHDKAERRDALIGKTLSFAIVVGLLWYACSVANPQDQDKLILFILFGYLGYCLEQGHNTIIAKLEAIEDRLGLR